QLTCAHDADVC
ncbi:MOSC domain protein, partial [Vibrio parahaemolyticus AQ3810]